MEQGKRPDPPTQARIDALARFKFTEAKLKALDIMAGYEDYWQRSKIFVDQCATNTFGLSPKQEAWMSKIHSGLQKLLSRKGYITALENHGYDPKFKDWLDDQIAAKRERFRSRDDSPPGDDIYDMWQ